MWALGTAELPAWLGPTCSGPPSSRSRQPLQNENRPPKLSWGPWSQTRPVNSRLGFCSADESD